MSVIANLDINLRGNAQGVVKGTQDAKNAIKELEKEEQAHDKLAQQSAKDVQSRFASLKQAILGVVPGVSALSAVFAPLKTAFGGLGKASDFGVGSAIGLGLAGLTASLAAAGSAWAGFGAANMQGVESLAKASRQLNITTEQLSGYQHAATVAGVGSESMTEGLKSLKAGLYEAAINGGTMAGALARIGLDSKQLATQGLDSSLEAIADKLQSVENTAQRTRLALQIFGGSGAAMLESTKGGAEGLRQALAEANQLGVAVTGKQAAEAEKANAAWRRMKEGILGAGRTAAITVTPLLEVVSDKIAEGIQWFNQYRDTITQTFQIAGAAIKNYEKVWDHLVTYVALQLAKLANSSVRVHDNVTDQIARAMADFANQFGDFSDTIRVLEQDMANKAQGKGVKGPLDEAIKVLENDLKRKDAELDKAIAGIVNAAGGNKKPGKDGAPTVEQYKTNGAVERGSGAAFAIIAGDQRDKMWKVANDQLQAQLAMLKELQKKKGGQAIGQGKL